MRLDADLGALIEAAEASALVWREAVGAPLPHRLEPYLHERLWMRRGGFVARGGEERYLYEGGTLVAIEEYEAIDETTRAPGACSPTTGVACWT